MNFVPLYVRTEYSLLESTNHINKLLSKVKEYGYTSCSICDKGNMHGVIKFYQEAMNLGIKPIIGLEVPVNIDKMEYTILLYAENSNGYQNLLRISTLNSLKGLIPVTEIMKYSRDLICIIPLRSSINKNINLSFPESIFNTFKLFSNVFLNVYLGLFFNTTDERKKLESLYYLFQKNNIKQVALHSDYFLESSHIDAYGTLQTIKNNSQYQPNDYDINSYLISNDEASFFLEKYPLLLSNVEEISNRCNVKISFNSLILPRFNPEIDSKKYLVELCKKGLQKRIKIEKIISIDTYIDRLQKELQIILDMGFADYFLIVWDYVKYAKLNNIMVGPGRGSAGASLVAYCLGITNIDPIKYNLLFERFLNPERITMPDIDIDFSDEDREKVINYVMKKYTTKRVAHIGTFSTFQAKLSISETAKIYKLPSAYLQQIYKLLEEELKQNPDSPLDEVINNSQTFNQLSTEYPEISKVLNIASVLYDLPKAVSTHAAGIIITEQPLVNYSALTKCGDNSYQTQLDAHDLESLGLLKMDVRIVR